MFVHRDALPLRKGRLEVSKLQSLGPVVLGRSALHLENFEDLVNLRVANKERSSLGHFRKNAPDGPDVNGR